MSASLSVRIPDTPAPTSKSAFTSPITAKTPRSMLRNLFVWKKNSPVTENIDAALPAANVVTRPQTAASNQQPPVVARKPSFSNRSRSETAVPQRSRSRSKSRRRSRSRCRAIWDPPPLFQAYSQAFMHDTLQIPSKGFLDWLPRNTSGRSSTRNPDGIDDEKDDVDSPTISHRRSMSDSNTPSLSKKLFFLFENGHILQYKAEGSQDRLPERVLELSRESVAFASDAVSGQHWVLEICPYGRADNEPKATTPKLSWSRMTLKNQDSKRLAERVLLVFDNADALFNWLFAIRKQIENFGGIEYQPDAPPLPSPDPKRPTLRHASSEHFKRKNGALFSRSSSALPLRVDDHTAHEKELPQIPTNLTYPKSGGSVRSTATSSVITTTSFERYRESYSGSSTAGTAISSDVSATSLSPTTEGFPPLLSPTLPREPKNRTVTDKSIPRTPTSPLHNSEERSPSPDTPPPPPPEPEEPPPPVPDKYLVERNQRSSFEPNGTKRPIPQVVIAHDITSPFQEEPSSKELLSVLELKGKHLYRDQAAYGMCTESSNDQPELITRLHHHGAKPSLGTSAKGAYGLFPRGAALDSKEESAPASERPLGLISRTHSTEQVGTTRIAMRSVSNTDIGQTLSGRSNTTIKRTAARTLPQLLAPLEVEQPLRSPAVTDMMLDSNFGTMPSGAATEPSTPIEIRVPSFGDIKIDKSLFESMRRAEVRNASRSPSPSPKARSIGPRRSLPNFQYGSSTVTGAPAGPPPSVPLPAVPPSVDGRNSKTSTPSKRTSAQGSTTRRPSTKSSSSARRIRSPAPSFSFPQTQTQTARSRSSSIKSPSSIDTQDPSPFVASLPTSRIEQTPATIGQVSVVAPPPPRTSSLSHKKSLSALSTKSNRSRAHTRSTSIKSIHNSISNFSTIPHLISSPCGAESDLDYANSGCFGIGASRPSP